MSNFEEIINDLTKKVKKFDTNLTSNFNFYLIGGGIALIILILFLCKRRKKPQDNFKLIFN